MITIELSTAVAFVLDALLDRWTSLDDEEPINIEHGAEWHAISILAWTIERRLADLELLGLQGDYNAKLNTARRSLIQALGEARRGTIDPGDHNQSLNTGLPD